MDLISFELNNCEFSAQAAGNSNNPLALILHGFPDSPKNWAELINLLAELGYYAVAPYMRGYHPSGIPADRDFSIGALVKDACEIYRKYSKDSGNVIIGHDWGSIAAYGAAASLNPSAVVLCSVPPLAVMTSALFDFKQLKQSWYMFYFQSDFAPSVVAANNFQFIKELWNEWCVSSDNSVAVENAIECFKTDENLKAALSYYKSLFSPGDSQYQAETLSVFKTISTRCLYIHGSLDSCVLAEYGQKTKDVIQEAQIEIIKDAGHFLMQDSKDNLLKIIKDFLIS
jgi:pimeloyl-ACP methyl ester carboxylesterase